MIPKELETMILPTLLETMGYQQFEDLLGFLKANESEDFVYSDLTDEDKELARQMFVAGFIKAGLIVHNAFKEASQYTQKDIMDMLTKKKEDLN